MVLEFLTEFVTGFTQMNTVLMLAVFLVFIVLAYKIFQALIKAFIVGVISAAFPLVANLMGLNVPLTLTNVIWFAIMGVTAYLMYATVTGGARIIRLILKPFSALFRKKPVQKIIIREKESETKA
jgi:hypothetical protein